MNKLSNKHCEVCLQKGIQKKVRTLCDECRELLCKECSDAHLLFKLSKNHSLIDLDPPREELTSADEDEFASDFLEHATVSETTVLYRAQVAVESGSNIGEGNKSKPKEELGAKSKEKKVSYPELKPKKITEFSVKRPDDKERVDVKDLLALRDKVIVVDYNNNKLKLYDSSCHYLSSTHLKEDAWGITRVDDDKFATCGGGNKVFLWTVRGQNILSEDEVYGVDYEANGIHYNGTYYSVLHCSYNAVTILDRQGKQVRKIVMKEAFGKKTTFRFDIHMDKATHDIYVPCWTPGGVLCMSVEGEAQWLSSLSGDGLRGITEIQGALCVADGATRCLHLISKTGQYIRKLVKEELTGNPYYILYDEQEQKLYVSYFSVSDKGNIISVYSV